MTTKLNLGTPAYDQVDKIVSVNSKLVQLLNTGAHDVDEIRQVVAQITDTVIDKSTEIRLPFYTDYGRNIHIGKHVFINSGVMLTDLGGIYLDDHVLIGPNVTLASVNHQLAPSQRRHLTLAPIHICENAWLGANVTVTPGVTIGANAVVAAGAVVTKDVPANTIVGGVPAKVIRTIKEKK